MEDIHYYEVNVNWENDRKGIMDSPVLTDKLEVATPPEFNKGMPNIWSPEHLLVAAANSCLMTTFLAIAENFKLEYHSFKSNGVGKLEKVDGKFMISEITLKPVIEISDLAEQEKALRVLNKSEAACLISNSIKAKINFEPTVNVVQTLT